MRFPKEMGFISPSFYRDRSREKREFSSMRPLKARARTFEEPSTGKSADKTSS